MRVSLFWLKHEDQSTLPSYQTLVGLIFGVPNVLIIDSHGITGQGPSREHFQVLWHELMFWKQ